MLIFILGGLRRPAQALLYMQYLSGGCLLLFTPGNFAARNLCRAARTDPPADSASHAVACIPFWTSYSASYISKLLPCLVLLFMQHCRKLQELPHFIFTELMRKKKSQQIWMKTTSFLHFPKQVHVCTHRVFYRTE